MIWIKAEDCLPKVNWSILLYLSSGAISTGYLAARKTKVVWKVHDEDEQDASVVYWMILPKEPGEKKEGG